MSDFETLFSPPAAAVMLRLLSVCTLLFGFGAAVARAQPAPPIRVALECQNTGCDEDYIRTELPFAVFVRDPADADVQVLLTSQRNGAGGRTYALRFRGQGPLDGQRSELSVPTAPTDTDDAERRALVRGFAAGLLPFVAQQGTLDRFRIVYTAPPQAQQAAPLADPWNRWIYALSFNANLNGEKRYQSHNLNLNANARRVTEGWKTQLSAYERENANVYVLSDGSEDRVSQSSQGVNALVVRSLGAQWSAGGEASVYRSTFDNTRGSVRVAPAVEYNVFPYRESTRRTITARYGMGVRHIAYRDTTIYAKTVETLFDHRLELDAGFQQPWGTLEMSATANQYLNHLDQYSISTDGGAEVRLFKGLSVSAHGGVRFIRNQRNISGVGVSDEDIYTRRRALATGYSYNAGFGLSYTFGSALSGTVNPRFN